MSNEQYLIVSYFAVGALALATAFLAFRHLRRSFGAAAEAAGEGPLARILKTLFLYGIVLPTMAGFLSVSFKSCDRGTYAKIVEDRSYLVAKNHEQASSSLRYAAIAVTAWGFILIVPLAAARNKAARAKQAGL